MIYNFFKRVIFAVVSTSIVIFIWLKIYSIFLPTMEWNDASKNQVGMSLMLLGSIFVISWLFSLKTLIGDTHKYFLGYMSIFILLLSLFIMYPESEGLGSDAIFFATCISFIFVVIQVLSDYRVIQFVRNKKEDLPAIFD